MASEDIGNADPRALTLAMEAWQVQERLGSPEGELAIAQAIIYLAVRQKVMPCTTHTMPPVPKWHKGHLKKCPCIYVMPQRVNESDGSWRWLPLRP